MKLFYALLLLLISSFAFSQTLPLTFESSATDNAFYDFDGGVATKVPNPQKSGINTSNTVMKLVKGTGETWAGSKIAMAAPFDLSTDRIFKVKVLSPVQGIKLLIKFEGPGPFTFQKESSAITAANVWEELTFDFSAEAVNNLNDTLVFMFDFQNEGDGSANSTYYFDDVTQSKGSGPILDLPVLPLTFESTAIAYPFSDFAGGETSIMTNPDKSGINTSNTVVRMIRNPGETYAASVIQMAGPIDFTDNKIVTMKVWSPVADIEVMLKFEGSPVDFDYGAFETMDTIRKANEWQELTFDYNAPDLFPPVNNNDNKIVFFFDFGNMGDGSANSTYYFDDVSFLGELSISSFTAPKVNLYPNPVLNQMTIDAGNKIQKVSVSTLLGQEVITAYPNSNNTLLQTSGLQKGIYLVKLTINNIESISRFIKE